METEFFPNPEGDGGAIGLGRRQSDIPTAAGAEPARPLYGLSEEQVTLVRPLHDAGVNHKHRNKARGNSGIHAGGAACRGPVAGLGRRADRSRSGGGLGSSALNLFHAALGLSLNLCMRRAGTPGEDCGETLALDDI